MKCYQNKHLKKKKEVWILVGRKKKKGGREKPLLTGNDRVWRRLQPISTSSTRSLVFPVPCSILACVMWFIRLLKEKCLYSYGPHWGRDSQIFFFFFASIYSTRKQANRRRLLSHLNLTANICYFGYVNSTVRLTLKRNQLILNTPSLPAV